MQTNFDFKSRVEELQFYIKSLHFFYSLTLNTPYNLNPYGTYLKERLNNGSKTLNFGTFIVILKSNALMMMYNLIESTVKQTIYKIYDKINLEDITYKELNSFYQKLFRQYSFSSNQSSLQNTQKIKEMAGKLIDNILKNENIFFDREKLNLSGNADLKKIKETYKKHDITLNNINNDCGVELLFIKNSRNALAHGSSTFSDTGKKLSVADVEKYSKDVISFLTFLIKEVNKFIQYKRYRL